MIQARKQNTTTYPAVFLMVDSNDHVTGKTGLTPSVTLSKNGAGFVAASGTVSELTNGWYVLAGNAADRNTLGSLAIHASATGTDPCDLLMLIVNYDPFVGLGSMAGSGAISWDVTVDDGTNPLDGVEVWVTTDPEGTSIVASGQTDALGVVTLTLDAGTYYCWKQLAGYNFSNPEVMVVS